MTEIQGGRWDTLLRRLFPVKGAAIAPAISPEIAPVAIVQPYRDEMHYLEGVRLGVGDVADSAVAGQYSHCCLINPPGSLTICVVEKVYVRSSGGAFTAYMGVAGAPGTTLTGKVRDLRWPGGTSGPSTDELVCGVLAYTNAAALGSACSQWLTAGTQFEDWPMRPWVLPPDSCLWVRGSAVNTSISANFWWRERTYELSEE